AIFLVNLSSRKYLICRSISLSVSQLISQRLFEIFYFKDTEFNIYSGVIYNHRKKIISKECNEIKEKIYHLFNIYRVSKLTVKIGSNCRKKTKAKTIYSNDK
ncbi:hypothetical protein BpHYR1_048272, partial [Brachionus plicatilis]